jgi:2-polyprenyl-3-methyl-5-hydroxy-6-metoxy-1,4-benzoquinol methylase
MNESKLKRWVRRTFGGNHDPVARNSAIHDKIAKQYDAAHGEIFNDIEQQRIRSALVQVSNFLDGPAEKYHALDFGAGTGNLTNHLLQLGFNVTAADVSIESLEVLKNRYNCKTVLLENGSTKILTSDSYDLVCLYSVLHHVPDYLALLVELDRICKPGGIIYIDHENSPMYWERLEEFKNIYKKISKMDLSKYIRFSNYVHKIKSMFIHKYTNEGDIHVWPDDHIEWHDIDRTLESLGYRRADESEF